MYVEDFARRGLVPRWGGGGAWQNPPCQFAVPSHNSSSSYLGVPTPTGMSDCYESMSRTPIRDRFPPPIRHSGYEKGSRPPFVIPAGIQRGGGRQDHRQPLVTTKVRESKTPAYAIRRRWIGHAFVSCLGTLGSKLRITRDEP